MTQKIKHALVSVSNKDGLVSLAKALRQHGVKIYSTGGTFKTLTQAGLDATQVSELTEFPEILGGRVKTLHPRIFGGILARRNLTEDLDILKEHHIPTIDMVVVNLYPFQEVLRRKDAPREELIENIDIGGPSLLRAAAKNHADVVVVVDPDDYGPIIEEMSRNGGEVSLKTRRRLAGKVFEHTCIYDAHIHSFFKSENESGESQEAGEESARALFPEHFSIQAERTAFLRYGENPHQNAAVYRAVKQGEKTTIIGAEQLQGKPLSYNNYMDAEAALEIVREFEEPTCCILKHANPCGAAVAKNLSEAFDKANACDPISAFGGIAAFNGEVTGEVAKKMTDKKFFEVIVAPQFSYEARTTFAKKKNLRLLQTGPFDPAEPTVTVRSLIGGYLLQERDLRDARPEDFKVVTRQQPTPEDLKALRFAWRIVKWVKSNAIVYASQDATLGIGAGQMSRIDSARFAAQKAQAPLKGCYMASDAFFPFRDCVDLAAELGVRAIIQPGGSVRDNESIEAADEHNLIMVFTGMRHFRH